MSTGSTALLNGNRHGVNILRKKDETIAQAIDEENEYFDLLSLDLAEFNPGQKPEITFIGVRRDSSLVARRVKLDGNPGAERFGFRGFENLVQVRWISHGTQFDNVRLRYRARPGRAPARLTSFLPKGGRGVRGGEGWPGYPVPGETRPRKQAPESQEGWP